MIENKYRKRAEEIFDNENSFLNIDKPYRESCINAMCGLAEEVSRDVGTKANVHNEPIETTANKLLDLFNISNSALIDYIENDAEIAIPIDEMFNEDGTHITKKKYGHVLLKYLVKELREHYC